MSLQDLLPLEAVLLYQVLFQGVDEAHDTLCPQEQLIYRVIPFYLVT